MAINTANVKLGTCSVIYGGIELGATMGGVEVEVTTETHKTMIDQFGNTPVKEFIISRAVTVRAPLAESTVEQIARVMPGSTLTATGGVKASGTILLGSNPTNGQTVVVNGVTITFNTASTGPHSVLIGASAGATAANLQAALANSVDERLTVAEYTVATATVTITYKDTGTAGNAFTLAAGTSGATVSGATLAGGANATRKKVAVEDGTGTDLLANARKLVLHPVANASTDRSEDFTIPLAGIAGSMAFMYKLDEERIINAEFTGYPDSTGLLFIVGDEGAV